MITQQTYALLALNVYAASPVNRLTPPPPWTEILPQPTGDTDGFAYAVYKNSVTNEVVISFRGTDNDVSDWTTNLGLSISQEKQAAAVYARILRVYGTDAQGHDLNNITFTGHSLGGSLAATMAVWFDRPAVVFDPAPSEVGAKFALDVIDVIGSLGTTAPQSIKDYWANITTQFAARENNVTSYFAPGSIVYAGSTVNNTITGAGLSNPVNFGINNMSSIGHMVDMHSQALLTAGLMSDAFRAATVTLQNALPLVMDKQLYALPPDGSERNFLIDLIRSEQGTGHKLTHFAADLNKLGTNIAGLNKAAQDAIIVQGIEWYYWQGTDYAGKEFLTQTGALLQYTTAQGAGLPRAENRASPYVKLWLDAALSSVQGGTLLVKTPIVGKFEQWNVSTASTGVSATALDTLKSQIFIGQGGADTFTGGSQNDLLFGGVGDDNLNGGGGSDQLCGGSGTDTYNFTGAFGKDTILDTDGLGNVQIDGQALGTAKGIGERGAWAIDLGAGVYAGLAVYDDPRSSTGKRLVITKGTDTTNTIDNFDLAAALSSQGCLKNQSRTWPTQCRG